MANAKKWYTTGLTSTDAKKMGPTFGEISNFAVELSGERKLQMSVKVRLPDGQEAQFRGGNAQDIEQIMVLTGARAHYHMKGKLVEVYVNGSVKGLSVNEYIGRNNGSRS